MKNYPDELCQLIIKNMDIIEQAPYVIEAVEEQIYSEIDKLIINFFETKNEWNEDCNLSNEQKEAIFLPLGWNNAEDESHYACYDIGFGGDVHYHLSHLLGVENSCLRIDFSINTDLFSTLTKTKMKQIFQNFYYNTPKIQEVGFVISDDKNYLSLPLILNKDLLAQEYPNFEQSLQPIHEALEKIMTVHEIFEDFVTELRTKYQ